MQQDFDAYLASSSDEEGGEGEGASVTEDEQIKKYRVRCVCAYGVCVCGMWCVSEVCVDIV